jgi:hypothetical protein
VSFDERAFVATVEAAVAHELLRLVSHPTVDEERALRTASGRPPVPSPWGTYQLHGKPYIRLFAGGRT